MDISSNYQLYLIQFTLIMQYTLSTGLQDIRLYRRLQGTLFSYIQGSFMHQTNSFFLRKIYKHTIKTYLWQRYKLDLELY